MYYQVGNACLEQSQAENLYYSQISAYITSSGKIIRPEYKKNTWVLEGKPLSLNLPQCNPLQNFQDGQEIGWIFFGVFAALFVILIVKRQLQ